MVWSTERPELFIILFDMSVLHKNTEQISYEIMRINKMIDMIISRNICFHGGSEFIKERLKLRVIGYDNEVINLLPEPSSGEDVTHFLKFLDDNPIRIEKANKMVHDGAGGFIEVEYPRPIWIENPKRNKIESNMHRAFMVTKKIIQAFIESFPASDAPIVLNIPGGEPYFEGKSTSLCKSETIDIVNSIKILCHNVRIINSIEEVNNSFPIDKGEVSEELKFFYDISSEIIDDDFEVPHSFIEGFPLSKKGAHYLCRMQDVWDFFQVKFHNDD